MTFEQADYYSKNQQAIIELTDLKLLKEMIDFKSFKPLYNTIAKNKHITLEFIRVQPSYFIRRVLQFTENQDIIDYYVNKSLYVNELIINEHITYEHKKILLQSPSLDGGIKSNTLLDMMENGIVSEQYVIDIVKSAKNDEYYFLTEISGDGRSTTPILLAVVTNTKNKNFADIIEVMLNRDNLPIDIYLALTKVKIVDALLLLANTSNEEVLDNLLNNRLTRTDRKLISKLLDNPLLFAMPKGIKYVEKLVKSKDENIKYILASKPKIPGKIRLGYAESNDSYLLENLLLSLSSDDIEFAELVFKKLASNPIFKKVDEFENNINLIVNLMSDDSTLFKLSIRNILFLKKVIQYSKSSILINKLLDHLLKINLKGFSFLKYLTNNKDLDASTLSRIESLTTDFDTLKRIVLHVNCNEPILDSIYKKCNGKSEYKGLLFHVNIVISKTSSNAKKLTRACNEALKIINRRQSGLLVSDAYKIFTNLAGNNKCPTNALLLVYEQAITRYEREKDVKSIRVLNLLGINSNFPKDKLLDLKIRTNQILEVSPDRRKLGGKFLSNDLYLLYIDCKKNGKMTFKEITSKRYSNSKDVIDFKKYMNGKQFTCKDIVEFDKTIKHDDDIINYVKKNCKVEKAEYRGGNQTIFKLTNHVVRFNIPESKLNEFFKLCDFTNDNIEQTKEYMKNKDHPISHTHLTIGWIRFTLFKDKGFIWVDELQSDLMNEKRKPIDNDKLIKSLKNVPDYILSRFIQVAHKIYGIKKVYFPSLQIKVDIYSHEPPASVYRDVPRKARFHESTIGKEDLTYLVNEMDEEEAMIPEKEEFMKYKIWVLTAKCEVADSIANAIMDNITYDLIQTMIISTVVNAAIGV